MGNIKTEAVELKASTMKNISELKSVDVDEAVITETRERDDGTSYVVKYVTIDNVDYRMPISVLSALKEIIAEKPKLKTFKVKRTGTTKEDTKYTTIPLD